MPRSTAFTDPLPSKSASGSAEKNTALSRPRSDAFTTPSLLRSLYFRSSGRRVASKAWSAQSNSSNSPWK